jgi:hypothetical protein
MTDAISAAAGKGQMVHAQAMQAQTQGQAAAKLHEQAGGIGSTDAPRPSARARSHEGSQFHAPSHSPTMSEPVRVSARGAHHLTTESAPALQGHPNGPAPGAQAGAEGRVQGETQADDSMVANQAFNSGAAASLFGDSPGSSTPSKISFGYDEEAGRPFFKLIDSETGEVVKQFPADEFLTMLKRLREVSDGFGTEGVLIDQRL